METDFFQSCGWFWVFQICWHIRCSTFKTSFFRIWKSSAGVPLSPLALSIVILPKAHLTIKKKKRERNIRVVEYLINSVMCAKSHQSWLTLCDPLDCNPPDYSFHGILQERILEWVAVPFSRVSSQPRVWTHFISPALPGRFFTIRPTRKAQSVNTSY